MAVTTPAARCPDAVSSLHLVLIDEAHTDGQTIKTAMQEVDRIWGCGLRVIWMTPDDASKLSPDEPVITMVIHPSLAPLKPAAGQSPHRGAPLGRLRFDERRHAWNLLDVSFSAIASIVMAASVVHLHVTDLPLGQQRLLVGRAL